MDIDIAEIQSRILAQFSSGNSMLFWEDEPGEYSEIVEGLELGSAALVNATGRELSAKRELLRSRPSGNVVVYRSGGMPRPEDDFLYDVKLSATPFSCRMEGIWATECGVSALLVDELAVHARFFGSKERRERLASSILSKGTADELRFAMLACCVSSKADNWRDAIRDVVRRLLIEHSRGQSASLHIIQECGLSGCLWSSIESMMGYSASGDGEPTVEDLALRMLQTRCEDVMPDGVTPLSADANRIIDSIATDSKTREDFERLANSFRGSIAGMVAADRRDIASLKGQDTIPEFDEWILKAMLAMAEAGTLRGSAADEIIRLRKHTLWFGSFAEHYKCIEAAISMFEKIDGYRSSVVAKTDAKSLFDAYCNEWSEVDRAYRCFVASFHAIPNGRFKRSAQSLYEKAMDGYDKFLVDLTDRWQLHIFDEGVYPPSSVPSQDRFFYEKVLKSFPKSEPGRRVGVIFSDALRYEVGAELATRFGLGEFTGSRRGVKGACEGMVCVLPSYTQLGMAALLPEGGMEIIPDSENVLKGGEPTNGLANRQRLIEDSIPGSVALQASSILDTGLPDVQGAPLVVVYHNVIDKRGDTRDTESEVFSACNEAIEQIARIANELLGSGCGKVIVTADHGFLYQDQSVAEYNYATVQDLDILTTAGSQAASRGRRYAIGTMLPESDMLVEYSAADLSLEGSYRVAFPKGIARLRLRGSGARYVHGGASLQENVVPVVTLTAVKRSQGASQTGVQGFLHGRPMVTGSTVMLDVYQTEACSESVTPLTVKVGLYDSSNGSHLLCASEKTIELASTSLSSEERKVPVTLQVTGDIDACDTCILRISTRIGRTNQFKPEWETTLVVNRAFGSDF